MMKALTLLQPFASLIGWQEKRWETRSFKSNHRGELAITASNNWNEDYRNLCFLEPFQSAVNRHGTGYDFGDKLVTIPAGSVIAVVKLSSIITTEAWLRDHDKDGKDFNEFSFGNYEPNRFAWEMKDVFLLPEPVPCRGMQMVWNLPGSVEAQVRKQLERIK